MKGTLPRLECHRREFGELAADVNAPPWNQIAPVFLSDAVTGAHLYDIPLEGWPLGMATSADGTRLYVAQGHFEVDYGTAWFEPCSAPKPRSVSRPPLGF